MTKSRGKIKYLIAGGLTSIFFLFGCQFKEKTLKVAATPVPHTVLLEVVKPELESQGIHLKIVEVDDYNLPNRLLFEKQVDANFFQHLPFLEEQNQRFGYNLKSLVSVHIEPLGIYSKKITTLDALPEHAIVAVPSDPTNEARALALLQETGLIKLKENKHNEYATIYDVAENLKDIKIKEVDAAFLPHILVDVDAAIIPANFAIQAQLSPSSDALALESSDSPYANIVAIREDCVNKEEIEQLRKALNSEKLRNFILEHFKGSILPAF